MRSCEPRAFTRDEYMHMQIAANMQHGLSPETAWEVADLQWRTLPVLSAASARGRSEEIREAKKDCRYWAQRVREASKSDRDACERCLRAARRNLEVLRDYSPWRP
jgi:hypothetical protein